MRVPHDTGGRESSSEASLLRKEVEQLESELTRERASRLAAEDAESRFRSLIDRASDPMFCYECDPPISIDLPLAEQVKQLYSSVLADCNPACAEAYGAQSVEQVTGQRLTALFGTRSGSLDSLFEDMIRNGYRTIDGEGIEILPNGSRRHFLNNAHGIVEDGMLVRIWGTFRDVTEHKEAEDALQRERQLTNAALDAQRDTFFLFDTSTGKALRWNRAFREISGYTDEEIAELPAPDAYYDPDDLERAAAFVAQLAGNHNGTIELDLVCKDGRRVPTEYSASMMSREGGGPAVVISIGRDVSQRRQAEAEIRQHRERLLRFLDSATDSIHLVDSSFELLEISESAVQRLKVEGSEAPEREDLLGRSLFDVYPFLRGSESEARFRRVLRTGEPQLFEHVAEHPDLGSIYLTVRAFRVGSDLGIIATDLTEIRRAEEERRSLERQVQQAQKLESLGVLAGGIAHDFNNLLVGVLGGTELALQHIAEDSPARSLLENAAKSTHRAAELANQMLAYSGKGRFIVEAASLTNLILDMKELLEASVPKKVRIDYALDEELPAAKVDVTQVRQIALNLVVNAAEAIGEEPGRIAVSTGTIRLDRTTLRGHYLGEEAAEGEYVYLRVQDSGQGMDETTRASIFDPFFTTKTTGRGLGLAAALGIVRGHHGAIDVDTEPGRGTTMTVMFPASSEAPLAATADRVETDTWKGSGTVLLIDDEEVVRAVGSAMLARLGFEVLVAEDGARGVDLYSQRADDIVLVLLDLAMPEMSGDQVFEELRKIRSDVKVLLSSGFSEQDIAEQFRFRGIAGFVPKPYKLETFSRKVREAMEASNGSADSRDRA